jgi:hypothetical protein
LTRALGRSIFLDWPIYLQQERADAIPLSRRR